MKIALICSILFGIYFFFYAYILLGRNIHLQNMVLEQKAIPLSDAALAQEDFIKFICDSRDVAYSYIEEVQKNLTKFKNDVDPLIKHFDEYGEVISNQRPDYQTMQKISIAYKELCNVLPTEEYN